jgi:hypothetical protein
MHFDWRLCRTDLLRVLLITQSQMGVGSPSEMVKEMDLKAVIPRILWVK